MEKITVYDPNWVMPSAEQIAEWKKEHGEDLHIIKSKHKGGTYVAILRSAGMADLQRASASEKAKTGTYNQSLFENCLLHTHADVKKIQAVYIGMVGKMDSVIVAAETEVEKL